MNSRLNYKDGYHKSFVDLYTIQDRISMAQGFNASKMLFGVQNYSAIVRYISAANKALRYVNNGHAMVIKRFAADE